MTPRTMALLVALAATTSLPVAARADLIQNGGFETWSGGYNGRQSQLGNSGTGGYSSIANWNVTANTYGFLVPAGSGQLDSVGVYSPQFGNNFRLWGTQNPLSVNANGSPAGLKGLYDIPAASPFGGNYIALDAAEGYRGAGISQLITNLVVGQKYAVNFAWASGQQFNFGGDTWEQLQVSLGSEIYTTQRVDNVFRGFTGWEQKEFVFTATNTSQTLNFLALGGPGGVPPFVLLDGITMNAVPEPSSIVLCGLGLVGLVGIGLRRRMKGLAA